MRVVVTGAAGFIGSRLSHELLDRGTEVVGIDRVGPSRGDRLTRAWATLVERRGFRGVVTDLRDSAELPGLVRGADAVVHLAGRAGTHQSWGEYPTYLSDNVEATARLAEACLSADVARLVHVSSSSVYGRVAIGDEAQRLNPVSPYGVSKLAAEATVRAYAEARGLPAVMLRLFSVYGPWQRPDMGVHAVIRSALSGGTFEMHGDGLQTRSMTFVGDVVAGIILAVSRGTAGEVYNLSGTSTVSLQEIVDEVARLVGRRPSGVPVLDPAGNQRHTSADFSRAALAFGYAPKVGISEGLGRQIAWQRAES